MPTLTAPRRLLASPVVDLLLGPHGIDRYLELINPALTVRDARAHVLAVHRQTERSVTLRLRPNAAWRGHRAGQFVPVGVEINGVRHTRTYSPASSEHRRGELELTITLHPDGLVSRHLQSGLAPGDVLYLGQAQGDFVLPQVRAPRQVLISGGSGITSVLSMLRTLCHERHAGEVDFIHYARTAADWLYYREVQELADRHANLRVRYVATREGGERVSAASLGLLTDAPVAVCGPRSLIEAVHQVWGDPAQVLSETFAPLELPAGEGSGTVHFTRSGASSPAGAGGSLLEQAEAAGLSPAFGCRMGICHTCTCRKTAGAVRNVLTGEVSESGEQDIQICISVPAGDVALDL
jgi:stearoyl-CoA 9-desaturase NADPH oxidoreductase